MKKVLAGILVILLLAVLGWWLSDYLTVDRCLDRGGHWDDDKQECGFGQAGTDTTQ